MFYSGSRPLRLIVNVLVYAAMSLLQDKFDVYTRVDVYVDHLVIPITDSIATNNINTQECITAAVDPP